MSDAPAKPLGAAAARRQRMMAELARKVAAEGADVGGDGVGTTPGSPLPPTGATTGGGGDDDVVALRASLADAQAALSTARVEMASLRRNHGHNLKAMTRERDLALAAAARAQGSGTVAGGAMPGGGGAGAAAAGMSALKEQVRDLEAQLRASRLRSAEVEKEAAELSSEVKQLRFRVQAAATMEAANGAYDQMIEQLVEMKLKVAEGEEARAVASNSLRQLERTAAAASERAEAAEGAKNDLVWAKIDLERAAAASTKQLDAANARVAELEAANKEMSDKFMALKISSDGGDLLEGAAPSARISMASSSLQEVDL